MAEVDGEEGDEDEHRDDGGQERDHGRADVLLLAVAIVARLRARRGDRGREERGEQRMAVARHGRPFRAAAGSAADCRGERARETRETGLTRLTAQHAVWSRLYRGDSRGV